MQRIFATQVKFLQSAQLPMGEDAFWRVVKAPPSSYIGEAATTGGPLPRGALCPAVVNEMSVPPAGGRAIDPCERSPVLEQYDGNAERIMVRPQEKVD